MVQVHVYPRPSLLVLQLPSTWGFQHQASRDNKVGGTGGEMFLRHKVSGRINVDIPVGGEPFSRPRASSSYRTGHDGTTGLYGTV